MRKQNILTAIIIIAVIALIGIIGYIAYEEITNRNKAKNEPVQQVEEKQEEKEEIEEPVEEQEPEEEYVGEEEKETQKEENTEISKDEKAIELAKQTYGEEEGVTFSIEEKKDNIYYIAVKSNATVISWYEVNTDTWEISEFY